MRALSILVASSVVAVLSLAAAPVQARDSSFAQVQRGRYLVAAGDCSACHTADNGKPFAGNRAVPTPFGTIYSSNITPDKATGIGDWTAEQFYDAMHNGIAPDGSHLYPAFPYPWYTRLTHDDVLAIKAYLDTLEPVKQEVKDPELPFPMNVRESIAAWNALFFKPGEFEPDPQKSAEWNRGAYLVEGLGHCSACHSPKNVLGAVKKGDKFEGGYGEGWYATRLTRSEPAGLGSWSKEDIVSYLKTGANEHARALGPMSEVVEHSTRFLSDADLAAMATYLKDLPGDDGQAPAQTASSDQQVLARGKQVYIDQCEGCHMENGEGLAHVFPPIKGNTGVHASDPTSLARLVIEGARSAATPERPVGFAMPAFGDKLSNADIADVLTYIRASWGNKASAVSESTIADVRGKVTAKQVATQ
jgi:mono/diheme cytochrome c family protein